MNKFYDAMDNLGYTSIESLSFHRLLDVEVTKLGYLVGDDLWSMLMKIIACEELIELMERKEGIVKKRALKRTFNNLTEKVGLILPKKIQLKKDIQTQLTLQNHFSGLLEIIQNRQEVLFTHEIGQLDEVLDPLREIIKNNYHSQQEKEKQSAFSCQQRENFRNLRFSFEKMQNNFDETISESSQYSPSSFYLEDFLNFLQEANASTKIELISDDSFELIGWKIVLKESDSEENLMLLSSTIEVGKEFKEILNNFNSEINQDIAILEERIEGINSTNLLKEMKEFFSMEEKIIRENSKTEDEIINYRVKVAEILEQISSVVFYVQIPSQFKSDLMTIEDLMHHDEDLKQFYLGPLFKFLDPSAFSCKLWPQLMEATNLIFFKTLEAANRTAFSFFEMNANSACKLIGVDEFVKNIGNYDLDQEFITAKTLIKRDVEEPLKTALIHILGKFIINEKVKNKELSITCYDEMVSTVHHEGSTEVISQLGNTIWPKLKSNPINALQKLYALIENRNTFTNKIKEAEKVRDEAKNELKRQELSIMNKMTRQKTKKIFDAILHSMLLSNKSQMNFNENIQAFNELKESVAMDIDDWDIDELKIELENANLSSNFQINIENSVHPLEVLEHFIVTHQKYAPQLFEYFNEKFYQLKKKYATTNLKIYNKYHKHLTINIKDMYQKLIETLASYNFDDSPQDLEACSRFGYAYAQKCLINGLIDYMKSCVKSSIVTKSKLEMFNRYHNENDNKVLHKIAEVHAALSKEKNEKNLRLTNLTADSYTKLKESIEKVPKYAEQPVFTPLEVKKRAYPMMNFLVVKMLRDTVHHFKMSYNVIFSEYLSQSSLFFYTHGEINEELEEDKFSWNCFDMTRLKSIDFVDKWEGGIKSKIGIEKIKQIKAFLLILHMINYISIFKFIIVSSKIFEELNDSLEVKIRAFLKTISTYVQVIIIEENRRAIVEPMDTSE